MGSSVLKSHEHKFEGRAPVIDEGMRRWYEACSCCLSEAYPQVKQALDDEQHRQAESAGMTANTR